MKTFNFVPRDTKIRFIEKRKIAYAVSGALVVLSLLLFAVKGLNYGIDFEGGILFEIETPQAANIGGIRSALGELNLGDSTIQKFGAENEVLIRIPRQPGGDAAQQLAVTQVKARLNRMYGDDIVYKRQETVGPKVSAELVQDGFLAVTLAVIAVLIYIWVRFEWQFGLGAVVALLHDVTLTIGLFSLIGLEFNLSIIAALLTIVGYSLNDTVVIYDRIRENLRKYKKIPLTDLINQSLNETLSRTIITSVTTLLALVVLLLFGGAVIQGFTAAMIWGVCVGTYSTVFIAAPILLRFNLRAETMNPEIQSP